jgi:hypothetical protein
MPDIDGYAAITALKSKPETKDIPVIFESFLLLRHLVRLVGYVIAWPYV